VFCVPSTFSHGRRPAAVTDLAQPPVTSPARRIGCVGSGDAGHHPRHAAQLRIVHCVTPPAVSCVSRRTDRPALPPPIPPIWRLIMLVVPSYASRSGPARSLSPTLVRTSPRRLWALLVPEPPLSARQQLNRPACARPVSLPPADGLVPSSNQTRGSTCAAEPRRRVPEAYHSQAHTAVSAFSRDPASTAAGRAVSEQCSGRC
jgi:hypothetical protein